VGVEVTGDLLDSLQELWVVQGGLDGLGQALADDHRPRDALDRAAGGPLPGAADSPKLSVPESR
jgi:hypothetical protein